MTVARGRQPWRMVGRRRVVGLSLWLISLSALLTLAFPWGVLDARAPGDEPDVVTSLEVWIARGVRFGLITVDTGSGLARGQYLRVDPWLEGVSVRPVLAGPTLHSRATVGEQVRRQGALAGVNGSFYGSNGRPLGLLIIDGLMVAEPIFERTSLFFGRGYFDEPIWWIGPAAFAGEVHGDGLSRPLNGVNRSPGREELVVFTPAYGPVARTSGETAAWAVVDGRVVAADWGEDLPIPPDGYVIAAGAQAQAPWLVAAGISLEATWGLAEKPPMESLEWALGGGPRLLRDGTVDVTADLERFQPDVARGRAPRTAAGVDDRGRLVLLTVNGRQASSVGLTLTELAQVMAGLGARDALNLDGGGSSTMVLRGDLFNLPSDGRERTVGNALLVFSDS